MFYEQLKEVCKENNTTVTTVLKKINLSTSSTGSWKKGVKPSAEILAKLAKELNTSMDYLWNGTNVETLNKEEKELINIYESISDIKKGRLIQFAYSLQDSNNDIYEELEEQENSKIKYKSYIDKERFIETVSAGTGMFLNGAESVKIQIEKNDLTLRTDYILKISGDSMMPTFNDEDLIMVKYMPFLEIGEIGIFLINNKAYVKKFGGDRLISLNKDYEDILLNEYDDIRCQGKVIGVLDKNWIKK